MELDSELAADVPSSHRFRRAIVGGLVFWHLALGIIIAFIPVPEGIWNWKARVLVCSTIGFVTGQVSSTAVWCALGPGGVLVRVPLAILCASLAGMALGSFTLNHSSQLDFWFSVGLIFVGWFLLQPPLWFVRGCLKYQMMLPAEPPGNRRAQFSLAYMLLWMLGVATLLGFGRVTLAKVSLSSDIGWSRYETPHFLLALGINLALALPVILLVLKMKRLVGRILTVAACSLAAGGIECILFRVFTNIVLDAGNVAGIFLSNGVHGLVLGGSLFVLTAVGYRFQREKVPFSSSPRSILANASKD